LWHGNPHRPNAGLVKEIIPNGFKFNGRMHDCIRFHTEHRTHNGGGKDYMAYGCLPPVTITLDYTWSFKYRAVNERSIGTTISMTAYTGAQWDGDGSASAPATKDWQVYQWTGVAPATGGTNMYFPTASDSIIEISEIQCEQSSFRNEYCEGTRSTTEALLDLSKNNNTITAVALTYNADNTFSFDGTNDYIAITNPSYPVSWDDPFSVEIVMYVATADTWNASGFLQGILARGGYAGSHGLQRSTTNNTVRMYLRSDTDTAAPSTTITRDNYHHIIGTWNGITLSLYKNGEFIASTTPTTITGVPDSADWRIGGNTAFSGDNGLYGEGDYPVARAYKTCLTAEEVKHNFASLRGRFGI